MSPIMIGPKWDWSTYPCPECGQQALEYDGSVKWRSGPRPGRKLATKKPIGFSPRADFDIAHYFHCENCGAKLYDAMDSYRPYLSIEKDAANQPHP